MAHKMPGIADLLMSGTPAGSSYHTEEMEKAAAEEAVGELYTAMTKEAKDDLFSTMKLAARAYGEELEQAFAPTIQKLAEIQANLWLAIEKLAEGGGGIGAPTNLVSSGQHVNDGPAVDLNDKNPGGRGWPATNAQEEAAKTKSVISGFNASGGRRLNPGIPSKYEGKNPFKHGKKAAYEEMLNAGVIDRATFDKLAEELEKEAGSGSPFVDSAIRGASGAGEAMASTARGGLKGLFSSGGQAGALKEHLLSALKGTGSQLHDIAANHPLPATGGLMAALLAARLGRGAGKAAPAMAAAAAPVAKAGMGGLGKILPLLAAGGGAAMLARRAMRGGEKEKAASPRGARGAAFQQALCQSLQNQ